MPEQENVHTINDGANHNAGLSTLSSRPRRFEGTKVVLSVGSLNRRKGHEHLIKAIHSIRRQTPNIRCIIIGKGPCERSLVRLVHELGLQDSIELWGQRPHDEVLAAMSWCDVFALPSWGESFGTVFAEAMSFAKPVVACKGEGLSEWIEDGAQGVLVEKRDSHSLAQALTCLLRDEHRARHIGERGRQLAQQKLNYSAISSQMVGLYEDLIRQPV